MAYCTKQQVRDATGMQNTTKIPDTYLDLKIGYADSVIDSYVGKRYTLPLSSPPQMIAYLSLEMSIAYLFLDQYGENSADTDKGWKKRLDALMGMLDDISKGKVLLFDSSGNEFPTNGSDIPSSYPNDASSSESATDSTAPKATMNKQF